MKSQIHDQIKQVLIGNVFQKSKPLKLEFILPAT